ncbi:hypothetical protein [Symbiobacterium terraclitae]|uniref:hypothetical protein n=1 Tax=Symbiobacterium terraclitae TaxID=557451 RepID=UPI0035B4FC51
MRITMAGIQRVLDLLDSDLTHMALDAEETTEQGLQDEYYRAALTPPFRDGNTTVREIYLDETQGVGRIRGIAVLSQATDTPGTGLLFAFDQVEIEKTDRNSLTISVEITVEEGA